MNDMEKALLKKMAHEFVDNDVPALIEIEEARLPDTYKGMVKMIMAVLIPPMIAAIDAKIDALTEAGV